MNVPELRNFKPGKPQDVESSGMLNTEAKETPETVKATNEMKEHVTSDPQFGKLGAKGRE